MDHSQGGTAQQVTNARLQLQNVDKLLVQLGEAVVRQDHHMLYDSSHWRFEKAQPLLNLKRSVDAVTDNDTDTIYFREAESEPARIISYHTPTGKLDLVNYLSPVRCSIVYFNQCILAIGGAISKDEFAQRIGNVVAINPHNGSIQKEYPDMPTSRSRTTAFTYFQPHSGHTRLIVIGGENAKNESLQTVEILNLTDPHGVWQRAQDIPETVICSSGTIVKGVIYLLGGWRRLNQPTSSVFICNVEELIKTIPLGANDKDAWMRLPNLPVFQAACASYNGRVIAVGGMSNDETVGDIRTYNVAKERWETIGYLPHPRYNCYAVKLHDKLMIFGGKKDSTNKQDMVNIYYKNIPA